MFCLAMGTEILFYRDGRSAESNGVVYNNDSNVRSYLEARKESL